MQMLLSLVALATPNVPVPIDTATTVPIQPELVQPETVSAEPLVAEGEGEDSIWDRLSFYADGRLRAESTLDQPSGEDRHRGRMRFRVGAKYEVMPGVTAEARVITTSGDSNNAHWDLGSGADGFNGADLALDRFNLKWQACDDFTLQGGKFAHVFQGPPVYGEFVWDADVQPAGLAATYGPGRNDRRGWDVRGAGYVAVENGNDKDPGMVGLQGNLYVPAGDELGLTFSTSIMDWFNLDAGTGVPGNQGNTDVMGDFLIWEGFAAVDHPGCKLGGATAFVQGMSNLDDDDDGDGYALGFALGGSGHAGATQGFATYYDLDANAVFSPPAQDDTPISGTGIGMGMDGVMVGARHWVTDSFAIKVWALTSNADAADDPLRVRLDFDFRVL